MIVVFHDAAGNITECCSGPEKHIKTSGRTYVEVDTWRPDWDVTHCVVDGNAVERPAADVAAEASAAAVRALRAKRDGLLRDQVDTFGPIRLMSMSDADKAALVAYRQALLDLPATTADPHNPVWPTLTLAAK